MHPDDKYYGEALREAESGIRRDELWGKAIARSSGNMQRCQSIYIELLAQQFATENGTPSRQHQLAHIQRGVTRTVRFLIWWFCCAVCCALLAAGGTKVLSRIYYENQYPTAMKNTYEAREQAYESLKKQLSSEGYNLSEKELSEDYYLTLNELVHKYPVNTALHFTNTKRDLENLNYQAQVESEMSDEEKALTGTGIFLSLMVFSVVWSRRKRRDF
ncbi:hypothetical protein ACI49Z_000751 [Cronobacter turicensis]|jgi:hypothetical protein|uniref:Uncharacterized protein n=1 Tax=Leclercia adecarboxylata TaxID=83655 RepID=A0ABU6I8W8_9ENTR|nr:hypothetical protein [Leclercia adecarboxylata]MDU2019072.1 hypothetical protein [Leclercia adecarboxylata]MEC3904415.1 hypothetical protein [Leclercia adecarboxylata]MEC3937962.1 hypothetical protein [Leclercia adecarboxylata]QEY54488.1 hypothetical protein FTX45_06440 [Leclercia adecarboxylata]QIG32347.1 hypothetical protein FY047_06485 [Leclercia adecarboxylata]